MLRRLLIAALIVVSLACVIQKSHAACNGRRCGLIEFLFGGYGPGPFGKGEFSYAGYTPPPIYTECGCRLR